MIRGRWPALPLALALALIGSASLARAQERATTLGDPSALDPELAGEPAPHAETYPGVVLRPLTLPAGMARIEQLVWYRIGAIPVPYRGVPTALTVGVHDDVEIGASWGVLDDPSVHVLARWISDPVIDVGASARVTFPAMTDGDTTMRLGVPVALRAARWLRVDAAVELDLLFTAQVSPMIVAPLTITVAPLETFFFGAFGSGAWLDAGPRAPAWLADAGGFVGWSARNVHGLIADGRIAVQVFLPGDEVVVSLGLRFFPRFWR